MKKSTPLVPKSCIVLGFSCVLLFGCEASKDAVTKTRQDLAKAYGQLQEYRKSAVKQAKEIEEVRKTVSETKEAVDDVKETAADVKRSATETTAKTKRGIRRVARRMPRSQKEANQMVVDHGKSLREWFQAKIDEFNAKHPDGILAEKNRRRPKPRKK